MRCKSGSGFADPDPSKTDLKNANQTGPDLELVRNKEIEMMKANWLQNSDLHRIRRYITDNLSWIIVPQINGICFNNFLCWSSTCWGKTKAVVNLWTFRLNKHTSPFFGDSRLLYIQAPWTSFCRIKMCTKRRLFSWGTFILDSSVCNRNRAGI